MKKFILGIIFGLLISSGVVFAANYLYKAEEVSYTPKDTSWNVDSVDKAINDLYTVANSGSGMSVIKTGTITSTTTIDLGTTLDPSQYMVNIHTNGYSVQQDGGGSTQMKWGYGTGAYLSAKTSSSCTITVSSGLTVSYEIIKLSNTKLESSNSNNTGVVKYGTITSTSTIDLGETLDPTKYIVNIYTNGYSRQQDGGGSTQMKWGYGNGAYLSTKTSTSCTINVSTGITASYEIVKIG